MKRTILLGLTTFHSNWREKIKEIKKYKIKQAALFATGVNLEQRKDLYCRLEKSPLESIPHVHVRTDFEPWELIYLTRRFKTEYFNIHGVPASMRWLSEVKKHKNRIYVENIHKIDHYFRRVLNSCAGICLDVSHFEDYGARQNDRTYIGFERLLKKYKVGCCHISAVKLKPREFYEQESGLTLKSFNSHRLSKLPELDYVKKYVKFLPKYVSIELVNSFKEQLTVKKYLDKIINS